MTGIPANTCPSCGYLLGAASCADGSDKQPNPGDPTVCIQCRAWLVFTDTLGLRLARPGEFSVDVEDRLRRLCAAVANATKPAMERLPCGCRMGTAIVAGQPAFLYEPCTPDCTYYQYVQAETAAQHKTIVTTVARSVSPAQLGALEPDPELSALHGQPIYRLTETMHDPEGSVTLEHDNLAQARAALRDREERC